MTTITPAPVSAFHYPVFDSDDAQIVRDRLITRTAYHGRSLAGDTPVYPLAGDWVRLHDGTLHQLAETGESGGKPKFTRPDGSFYLERDGSLSYRGNTRAAVPLDILSPAGVNHPGRAYIFHHNQWLPGHEVEFDIDLQVWRCPWLRHYPKKEVSES